MNRQQDDWVPGDLIEIKEQGVLRHGIVVSVPNRFRDVLTAYVPDPGRRDWDVQHGVIVWWPDPATVRPIKRSPWGVTLRKAFDADPWGLRPYEGSPRQARAKASADAMAEAVGE